MIDDQVENRVIAMTREDFSRAIIDVAEQRQYLGGELLEFISDERTCQQVGALIGTDGEIKDGVFGIKFLNGTVDRFRCAVIWNDWWNDYSSRCVENGWPLRGIIIDAPDVDVDSENGHTTYRHPERHLKLEFK